MNRRTLIVVIFSVLFVLQAVLLLSWHFTSDKPVQAVDVAVSVLTLALTAIIYIASTRFYFAAIKRSTEAHVAREGAKLEHSLELYRSIAAREEQLTRKVCSAIENELVLAQEDLAQGDVSKADARLQNSLNMATEAIPSRCRNVTIAAVLEAESRQCENDAVRLTSEVAVPEEIGLPDIDMAALLFSLIDRALDECRAQREADPSSNPSIAVRMLTNTGQLLIEVENTCEGSDGTDRGSKDGYDWNDKVIEGFTKGHGGIVEHSSDDKTHRTSVMIPLPTAAAA